MSSTAYLAVLCVCAYLAAASWLRFTRDDRPHSETPYPLPEGRG